jgi:alkyl sulfatase BDS1-like metallo-beta-lactamase superfamily hydrolase
LVVFLNGPAAAEQNHLYPKGKMPSKFTVELHNGLRRSLPFEDKRDFEEHKRGFIAAPPYKQIMAEAGHVAWDMNQCLVQSFYCQNKSLSTMIKS